MHQRRINFCCLFGQRCIFVAGAFGGFHQPCDLLQQGFLAQPLGPNFERAGKVEHTRAHPCPRTHRLRQGFAGQHRGVKLAIAPHHHPVGGQALTRGHGQNIARAQGVQRHGFFAVIGDAAGFLHL